MNLLLDTHTVIWAMLEPERLSPTATTLMNDPSNRLAVSIASLWEITIKAGTEKIVIPGADIDSIIRNLTAFRIETMPIHNTHLLALQVLPLHHRDPFDRILVAQSQAEKMPLVTVDEIIHRYPLDTIW